MIMVEKYGNYDKYPTKEIMGYKAWRGYANIAAELKQRVAGKKKAVIVLETYTEVDIAEILEGLKGVYDQAFNAEDCAMSDESYNARIREFLTDDRVFGIMNTLNVQDVYIPEKIAEMREKIAAEHGVILVYGVGASLICEGDFLVYADLARWEIQLRFAKGGTNWKTANSSAPKLAKFKQGFFVEWRMADRLKRRLLKKIDYLLDTNRKGDPAMAEGDGFRAGLEKFASEPFRLVPYFAPEVWGGQWMKEICDLDKSASNYAWAFDGVPEENSLYMSFNGIRIEIPSIDVVFYRPQKLLGSRVHGRFGDEYPIRFDFLDTMGGQNLSLQVHPLTEYIQNTFNMHYTQDESYYILDCGEDCNVYLGLKEGIDGNAMIADLRLAQTGATAFPAEKYVNTWKVKKHDHFLIPGGTVHCSGKDTMVLEISATPYIFTFKLWDWGRVGLDGIPRPVHIDHGEKVIQWDRTTSWVKENLVNKFYTISDDGKNKIEHTGLHEREFIETRRYTITSAVEAESEGSVSQCNVADGRGAIIESTDGSFAPYEVHYAETFIIPESVKKFRIKPLDKSVTIIRATVR